MALKLKPVSEPATDRAQATVRGHQGKVRQGLALAAAGTAAACLGLFLWSRGKNRARVETSTEDELEAHPS